MVSDEGQRKEYCPKCKEEMELKIRLNTTANYLVSMQIPTEMPYSVYQCPKCKNIEPI